MHSMESFTPSAVRYFPIPQARQSVTSPVPEPYFPAKQSLQTLEPRPVEKVPRAQGVQAEVRAAAEA